MGDPPVPKGEYDLFADDDDVIGLTVAKTYPHGWPIVGVDPPSMPTHDEFEVGRFIARCLTNASGVLDHLDNQERIKSVFAATAPVHTTVCPTCGGSGLSAVTELTREAEAMGLYAAPDDQETEGDHG